MNIQQELNIPAITKKDTVSGKMFTLRKMRQLDILQVHKIETATFPTPWSIESFFSELEEKKYSLCMVVTLDNKVVAFIITWILFDEAHIANLAVSKKFRHRGIASWIISQFIEICKTQNVEYIHLEVRKSNQHAIKLYEKSGFVTTGTRPNYYEAENEDALLMSCKLNYIPAKRSKYGLV